MWDLFIDSCSWQSFVSSYYVLTLFLHWFYKMKCKLEHFLLYFLSAKEKSMSGESTCNRCSLMQMDPNNNTIHVITSFFYPQIPTKLWNLLSDHCNVIKSVSMRRPGRTRQGVIMLKSPISLKLGTNVRYQELTYVTECQVKILNSLGDPGSPCKNRHFARLCIIN